MDKKTGERLAQHLPDFETASGLAVHRAGNDPLTTNQLQQPRAADQTADIAPFDDRQRLLGPRYFPLRNPIERTATPSTRLSLPVKPIAASVLRLKADSA